MALCKPATLSAVWGRGKITTGTFHSQASLQVQRETLSLIGQRVIQQDICSLSLTSMNMLLHTHVSTQRHVYIHHRLTYAYTIETCAYTTDTCVHTPQPHVCIHHRLIHYPRTQSLITLNTALTKGYGIAAETQTPS